MATVARGAREAYLRDNFVLNLATVERVFNPASVCLAYLLSGVATLALGVLRSPTAVAAVFGAYAVGLATFVLFERRRFRRELERYRHFLEPNGPKPNPKATRNLPPYMLQIEDAADPQMLDAMLVLGGDSLEEFTALTRRVRRMMGPYIIGPVGVLVGVTLFAFVSLALVIDRGAWQLHLGELALVGMALVAPRVALVEAREYSDLVRKQNTRRLSAAETLVETFPIGRDPFLDGRVVKFREGRYIVSAEALAAKIGRRKKDSRKKNSRRRYEGDWLAIDACLIAVVLVSIIAFVLHPTSGILVQ